MSIKQNSLIDAAYGKWLQNINAMSEYLTNLQEENKNKAKLMQQMIREVSLNGKSLTKAELNEKFTLLLPKYFKHLASKGPVISDPKEFSSCHCCRKKITDLDLLICTDCSRQFLIPEHPKGGSVPEEINDKKAKQTSKSSKRLNKKDHFFAFPYHKIQKEVQIKMTKSIAQLYFKQKEIFYEGDLFLKDPKLTTLLSKEATKELVYIYIFFYFHIVFY